jgi:phage terminase large subunit
MFQRTTAIDKLLAIQCRKKVIQGGTWAGKTYGIIPCIIDYAAKNTNKTCTIVAETIPALKGGAIKDFKNIMRDTGRWVDSRWNASDLHYTFGTNTKVEFKSFDSVGKAQAAGKRDVLFINEAPYVQYEIADALIGRTTEDIWIDFNPTSEFWAHTEILPNKDAEFLLLKYTDNEALPATILDELMMKLDKAYHNPAMGNVAGNIKSSYWANWCKVYVDGEIGSLQGTVFQFTQCGQIPMEAELLAYGIDWGFTNDPTTLVAMYRINKTLYLEELIFQTGMRNVDIATKMNELGISKQVPIYCDDAEPKSIADLNSLGYGNAQRAYKDRINTSIDLLQGYELHVLSSSLNMVKEFRNYRWETDASGKSTNKPIKSFNHTIDPLRYIATNTLIGATGEYYLM